MNIGHPTFQAALDALAADRGLERVLVAEEAAAAFGQTLHDEGPGVDDPRWPELVQTFRSMGPVERLIAWTLAIEPEPNTFRNVFRPGEEDLRLTCKARYDRYMARVRACHTHLSPLFVQVFGVNPAAILIKKAREQ